MEHSSESWYIVQSASGQCEILCQSTGESPDEDASKDSLQENSEDSAALNDSSSNSLSEDALKQWGPFKTQSQAIAKRVGLIRAGKCKPS